MFKDSKAFASFSVDNIEVAKHFYGEILGLDVKVEDYGVLKIQTQGNNPIMVYPKDDHLAATYTVLNFPVADIEVAVDKLSAKGVKFEHYKGDLQTDAKGISRNGPGPLMVWFRDPAGNFLSLLQQK